MGCIIQRPTGRYMSYATNGPVLVSIPLPYGQHVSESITDRRSTPSTLSLLNFPSLILLIHTISPPVGLVSTEYLSSSRVDDCLYVSHADPQLLPYRFRVPPPQCLIGTCCCTLHTPQPIRIKNSPAAFN